MANEVKLECYTFQVREKRSENYLNLESIEEKDFFNLFTDYIGDFHDELLTSAKKKKSLQFNNDSMKYGSIDRMISGVIECGDYGIGGTIRNIETGDVRLQKNTNDSDIKPFYFLIFIPNEKQKGILILQRFGIHGIKTVFINHLKEYLSKELQNSTIEVNPLVSKELAKIFIESGGIKEISLRKHSLPTDIINSLGLGTHETEILDLELKLIAKRGRKLPYNNRIKKFVNDPNAKLFDVKEFNGLGFDSEHKASVTITHNNNTRTIDLSDSGQIRPYYNIDQEVEKDKNNHPIFNSIDMIARKLVQDLNKEFNL